MVGQLTSAVPLHYRSFVLHRTMSTYPRTDWTPRADPLAGRRVEPESCRAIIRNGGLTTATGASLPPSTRAASGTAVTGRAVGGSEPTVQVHLIEVTGAAADAYLDEYRKAGPECADIHVTGGRASVVERELAGFGERSRYIVRTYPVAGKPWVERLLFYRTTRYVAHVSRYGPAESEESFLAFARAVRDHAAGKLK